MEHNQLTAVMNLKASCNIGQVHPHTVGVGLALVSNSQKTLCDSGRQLESTNLVLAQMPPRLLLERLKDGDESEMHLVCSIWARSDGEHNVPDAPNVVAGFLVVLERRAECVQVAGRGSGGIGYFGLHGEAKGLENVGFVPRKLPLPDELEPREVVCVVRHDAGSVGAGRCVGAGTAPLSDNATIDGCVEVGVRKIGWSEAGGSWVGVERCGERRGTCAGSQPKHKQG